MTDKQDSAGELEREAQALVSDIVMDEDRTRMECERIALTALQRAYDAGLAEGRKRERGVWEKIVDRLKVAAAGTGYDHEAEIHNEALTNLLAMREEWARKCESDPNPPEDPKP